MGRMTKDLDVLDSPEMGQELSEALSAARAWMEIMPEKSNAHPGTLLVGEYALLMVKSTLPGQSLKPSSKGQLTFSRSPSVGIGWKVVDCTATDGLGDTSQKLLDDRGCPIDELLMPAPLLGPARPIALMRHQEAVARFAAFKFPDRDRLHLSCGIQLCRGACQKVNVLKGRNVPNV